MLLSKGGITMWASLKVLSIEMDLDESQSKVFIKERDADVFSKNPFVPHSLRALKRFRFTSFSC
jgi:hypothetical protein